MQQSNTTGIATNKKIVELYQDMNENKLILQPSFQRKLVWNNKHKENFLQTILGQYPFPEVYFADGNIDTENIQSTKQVIDGQQRLSTIYQYISDNDDLVLKNIKKFKNLSQIEKELFLNYTVVVRDLGKLSDIQIKEIFSRINSVNYALNAMEINNALYEGEFITTGKEIIKTKLLEKLDVLSDSEISRMKDLEFIIILMTTIEIGGYFNSNREIESYIKKFEDEYPNKDKIKKCFISVLTFINNLNLPIDSLWYRKSSIFTLISEIMFQIYRHDKCLPDTNIICDILITLEKKILQSKSNGTMDKYYEFYNYIYQGTSSRKGRNVRGEILREEIKQLF
ncbi:DUF262 domain-containing protein [Anaerofustis stercorihominis]|uniref:DUF262 domain-containing protein n=2 Tax=Anaerofustis stercorihominis TaxID=214853 RepID=A0A3E3E2N9_9FIRM|nr:DUF262 domain-containing protein [Anaerofustis stercorihominis]